MKKFSLIFIICLISCQVALSQTNFTAYIFLAEECPVCNYLGKTLQKLSTEYADDITFVAVFPQRRSNIKTASLFKRKYGLSLFTIEIDHDRTITNRYQAAVTPEVVLVNNQDEILYQGRINNSYAAPGRMRHGKVTEDLEVAIKKILTDHPVPKPWPDPIGCYITKR